jgi:hypothetical protein
MSRLSIEVTPEQHQRLKAMAALSGQTIKDYILERALPALPETDALSEEEALRHLEAFLKPRIEEAERGELVNQSVTEIIADLKQERRARNVRHHPRRKARYSGHLGLYGRAVGRAASRPLYGTARNVLSGIG